LGLLWRFRASEDVDGAFAQLNALHVAVHKLEEDLLWSFRDVDGAFAQLNALHVAVHKLEADLLWGFRDVDRAFAQLRVAVQKLERRVWVSGFQGFGRGVCATKRTSCNRPNA
jgi:hypothetical protein